MITARTTSNDLIRKLNPRRFPGMSAKMAAIVGCVLGQDFAEPQIVEMVITSDGCVLARNDGDIGCNAFIGNVEEMDENWGRLLDVACLSTEERTEADRLYKTAFTDYRR